METFRNVIVASSEDWAGVAATHIAARMRLAIEARGVCHLASAGGNTPAAVYRALRADWSRVEIWFGDERCVPPDHPDSNYGMVAESIAGTPTLHRMEGERADRQAAADDYAELLPERLDIALLGMGGDGHTASLFPGQCPTGRVAVVRSPRPPPWRLTLTAEELLRARERIVLVTGSGKADTVRRALCEPGANLPIQVAADDTWILDEAAAAAVRE
ncbi:MAG: 6-phosphogluconolactonase [Planctomycetes bacterium]|nr:6-phosphogluconolactonase [Planctomycetota bacterium]